MTHDELAEDLAGHLRTQRRMVWLNMQLGESGSPRPDVYALYKSFSHPAPIAYEVKVSVSDFRADVTSGKWQAYLPYAGGVVFAVPTGLVPREQVPAHCGLVVRGPVGWRAAKKPVLRLVTIPQEALLKLVIDGVEREGPRVRARCRSEPDLTKKLGEQVAACVRDLQTGEIALAAANQRAESIVAHAQREAERIRGEVAAQAPALWSQLLEALALPQDADPWTVQATVRTLRDQARQHPGARDHQRLTEIVQRALEHHGFKGP